MFLYCTDNTTGAFYVDNTLCTLMPEYSLNDQTFKTFPVEYGGDHTGVRLDDEVDESYSHYGKEYAALVAPNGAYALLVANSTIRALYLWDDEITGAKATISNSSDAAGLTVLGSAGESISISSGSGGTSIILTEDGGQRQTYTGTLAAAVAAGNKQVRNGLICNS